MREAGSFQEVDGNGVRSWTLWLSYLFGTLEKIDCRDSFLCKWSYYSFVFQCVREHSVVFSLKMKKGV